jgi:hypothetical protein
MEAFGRVARRHDHAAVLDDDARASAAANHEPKTIARPAITLLAMTTPSTFYDAMRRRILDGFLNRFLVVEHQGARRPMLGWHDAPRSRSFGQFDWPAPMVSPNAR